jgi:hypothetical protein
MPAAHMLCDQHVANPGMGLLFAGEWANSAVYLLEGQMADGQTALADQC